MSLLFQPEGSPLLIMLEDVMTMDRNALSHTLVRFYLAHGSVLPFLDTLTIREIHLTGECWWAGQWEEFDELVLFVFSESEHTVQKQQFSIKIV